MASSNATSIRYIPATRFQGSKDGYYFGSGREGLGYHLDVSRQVYQSTQPPKSIESHLDITFDAAKKRKREEEALKSVEEIPSTFLRGLDHYISM